MHLTLLRSYSNKASQSRVLSISLDPAICSIASAKLGFFQRFLVAPKSHLKCLDYQPLKDMELERQELRKTTMDCVENCGYNNLSLSRFVSMVFSLKALFNIYGYIQCGQGHGVSNMTNWQNRIFCGYLARRPNSLHHFVLILRIPVMCQAYASLREKASHELPAKSSLLCTLP